MHPTIYNEFERICAKQGAAGEILEIGAIPTKASLLCMKSLSGATAKVGIDLSPPSKFEDFEILQGNSNHMDCFEDDRFRIDKACGPLCFAPLTFSGGSRQGMKSPVNWLFPLRVGPFGARSLAVVTRRELRLDS